MRELLLAAVASIALTGATQADIGLNLKTYRYHKGNVGLNHINRI